MVRIVPALLCASFLSASLLSSQATIIVDESGGAGSHYKDLPSAITAAKAGDILLLRAGIYQFPAKLTKPLTIQGIATTPVHVRVPAGSGGEMPLAIESIPKGATLALKSLVITYSRVYFGRQYATNINNNAGTILLDRVAFLFNPVSTSTPTAVDVFAKNCACVVMRKCISLAVEVENSRLLLEGSVVEGLSTWFISHGPQIYGSPGLMATSSEVSITDSWVIGGKYTSSYQPPRAAFPGIQCSGTKLFVRGSNARVLGGSGGDGNTAILGNYNSTLWLDKVSTVQPTGSFKAISNFPTGAVTSRALPSVRSDNDASLGKDWDYTLRSPAGQTYMLHLSLFGSAAFPMPNSESFHLDPTFLLLLQSGTQKSTGATSFSTAVPNLPDLRGWVFAVQGHSVNGTFADLTNAIALSVR